MSLHRSARRLPGTASGCNQSTSPGCARSCYLPGVPPCQGWLLGWVSFPRADAARLFFFRRLCGFSNPGAWCKEVHESTQFPHRFPCGRAPLRQRRAARVSGCEKMGTVPAPTTTNADFKDFGEARSGLYPICSQPLSKRLSQAGQSSTRKPPTDPVTPAIPPATAGVSAHQVDKFQRLRSIGGRFPTSHPFELADSTYLVNNSSFWHWNCHTPEEYENRSRARFRRQLSQFENCCNVDASECCRRRFSNTFDNRRLRDE